MKQSGKTILTVLIAVVCVVLCVIFYSYYQSKASRFSYWEIEGQGPEITEVSAKKLGKEYKGKSQDGKTYYQLTMKIKNQSNYGRDSNSIYVSYDAYEYLHYGMVEVIEDTLSFSSSDSNYYLPPGKEAEVFEIICVEDSCKKINVLYWLLNEAEEQRIPVDL